MYFSELPLNDDILDALDAMRFEECTPIQEQSIPHLLDGKDLIGIAQTGTGKTAAYLLPVLNRISLGNMPKDRINCVIMVPTRELAQQIDNQLEAFSYFLPVSGLAVYGGNDGERYDQEVRSMKLGTDILIATPGRLKSHLALGNADLSQTSIFILDEADRMLDMGFVDDINKIVSYLPQKRQTILFSATMPNEIQSLANSILHNPVSIELAIAKPAEKIDQSAYICHEGQKIGIVRQLFSDKELKRVIVFSSSKKKVHELTYILKREHLNVREMHSDLEQKERDEVLRDFKNNKVDIIVSTDLLSRGIDIDDIEMVINYDVPRNADDYVHRIGRTARANKYGKAITLVNEGDQYFFSRIEKVIKMTVRKAPVPESLGTAPEYTEGKSGKFGRKNNFRHQSGPRKDGATKREKTGDSAGKAAFSRRRKPGFRPKKRSDQEH